MTDNVTPDTAARAHLDVLVTASDQADRDGYSRLASDLHQAHEFFVALISELATARQALRLAARAFAQYAEETNAPSEEAIQGFMEGFIQDAQLREVVRRVTSDTAAREFDSHREEAEDMAMYRPGTLVDRYVEAMERIDALLSELATAREENDQLRARVSVIAGSEDRVLADLEAELVVVRRQLEAAEELLRDCDSYFIQFDVERTDGRTSPIRERLVAFFGEARAVLDARTVEHKASS